MWCDFIRGEIQGQEGILEPVTHSEWAAPVVPIVKQDGSVRLCGDYKLTINRAAVVERYPLPRIEDMLSCLAKGKVFTKLDLSHAYMQLALDPESKRYVTISTQKGLFQYSRLPFGISSAPAIFQRTMERVLHGIPNTIVYIDDILVTGASDKEHLETLEKVLSKLEESGMRLKRSKCVFMVPSVEYLGHHISAEGIRPTEDKKKAILEAPAPQNVSQLRSFLGLINFYGKFLRNLADTLAPLYKLLQKKEKWQWGPSQERAFKEAKAQLTSPCLLAHFDPGEKLILSCDASPYGIGAVLSHQFEDGVEKPIAYASRSLAPAEKKYAHIEKEGLAVIYGVKRFHQYLWGRPFTVYSDHKPLQYLFSESRPVPVMASGRIMRWALTLSAYEYRIVYRSAGKQGNADGLSRLPVEEAPEVVPLPGDLVLMMEALADTDSPVTVTTIRSATARDNVLSKVRELIIKGWPAGKVLGQEFEQYSRKAMELSVQDGCVLWGSRVVIPLALRPVVIQMLHEGHPGTSRMKALARGVVWWPGMDVELESKVKTCGACQANQKSPPQAPLHPWEWPSKPWSRLHIDFAGPFLGRTFLIVVDAHSKWLEVTPVSSTSSQQVVRVLRNLFSTHGLPDVIVSDNGTAFTCVEFETFMKRNGIRHVRCAPYHPSSNGLAERAVQTFKEAVKKTKGDIDVRIARFLFQYRITPHATTGQSPAFLLLRRQPRSALDLMVPDVGSRVRKSQERQKVNHDQGVKVRLFSVGDAVFMKNFSGSPKWIPGRVIANRGPLSLVIQLDNGSKVNRHVDHVRVREQEGDNAGEEEEADGDILPPPESAEPDPEVPADRQELPPQAPVMEEVPIPTAGGAAPALRRSTRTHYPPERYGWNLRREECSNWLIIEHATGHGACAVTSLGNT